MRFIFFSTIFLFQCALLQAQSVDAQNNVSDITRIDKSTKTTEKGFTGSFQIGTMFYNPVESELDIDLTLNVDYSIRATLSYQFSKKLSVGIVTGLDEYPITVFFPIGIFADTRLGKGKVQWYNRLISGYSFPSAKPTSEKAFKGGAFINFETGLWINTTPRGALAITVGHYRQRAQQTSKEVYRYPGVGDLVQAFSFRRMVINVGYHVKM